MKISELEKEIENISNNIDKKTNYLDNLKKDNSEIDENFQENIVRNNLGDLYSKERDMMAEGINEILNKVVEMEDDERLVVGDYLYEQNLIEFCSGGFGGYKSPTSCSGCHRGEKNVSELKLNAYVEFFGNRVYGIPKEVVKGALSRLVGSEEKKVIKNLEKKISQTTKTIDKLEDKKYEKIKLKQTYELMDKSGSDYEKVDKEMPEFMKLIDDCGKNRSSVSYITAKPEKSIGVILANESYYNGTAGYEYGVRVTVLRNGETEDEYFKWRDAYYPEKDREEFYFKRAFITDIAEDYFEVSLESKDYEITRKYNLKEQKNNLKLLENKLNSEEIKVFNKHFKEEKDKLIDLLYRKDGMMPDYVKTLGLQGNQSAAFEPSGRRVPYEKPEVVDEFINSGEGEGVVVMKTQIDFRAGRGLQYEWSAYKISQDETREIISENAYQIEIGNGKRIGLKANEIYKKLKQKEE